MDASELALIELLDHLGRQAAHLKIPAPRKGDSVSGWCALERGAKASLRAYLAKNFPNGSEELLGRPSLSFEELVALLSSPRGNPAP
jgi:hypothetical protein